MKKFECIVTVTHKVGVELDENILTEEWMKKFRETFYGFHSLAEHAQQLAFAQVKFGLDSFIEGYGDVTRNGELTYKPQYDSTGLRLPEKRVAAPGINILTKASAFLGDGGEFDTDVYEIMPDGKKVLVG